MGKPRASASTGATDGGGQILFVSNTFKFVRGADDTKWANIQAGGIQGTTVRTTSGANLDNLKANIGTLANLRTATKSYLVEAINELLQRIAVLEEK